MKELKSKLESVEAEIAKLNLEREALRLQIAALSTPFNVGNRVKIKGGTAVYQITAILPGWGNKPQLMGAKIKKDGTPGAVSSELYLWEKDGITLA